MKGRLYKPPTEKALEYFDIYYKPSFKELWPSLRLALLSHGKKSAVINGYADSEKYEDRFIESGALDLVDRARQFQSNADHIERSEPDSLKNTQNPSQTISSESDDIRYSYDSEIITQISIDNPYQSEMHLNADLDNQTVQMDRKDLDAFLPVKKLYSDAQSEVLEEVTQTFYSPLDMKIDVVKPRPLTLPASLKAYCFPTGDISVFQRPKVDGDGGLCFYFMDAASVLPVVALDLQEGDEVLDLCAAPGGKSLCILQTGLAGRLVCNDKSRARLKRLHDVMNYHIPHMSREHVTIEKGDGIGYQGEFDKVLVDVPCNTDRISLMVDRYNLYGPSRLGDRLALPQTQKDLLVSAIKCCRVGGSVVYSTCTLAAAQNDGTVQQAFDEITRNTDIRIVIEDLAEISQIFKDTFKFYNRCRLGQLVIPTITNNFGPMYICRIKRIK